MSTPLLQALAIPAVISAVAASQLTSIWGDAVGAFFSLSPVEQASIMALLFALIFGSVALASTLGGASASSSGSRFAACFRSTQTPEYPIDKINKAKTSKDKFLAIFPMLKDEIIDYLSEENELLTEAADWVNEMVEYSVPGGKSNRGTTVIDVYRTLRGGRELTAYETARASVAGWTIEFLQAFFLVADDVMDESESRRGQPCWYKLPKVKLIAINDSFLLESFVFQILRTHFGTEPFYPAMLELLLDVTQKTECGQLLDLTSQPQGQATVDLERFTLERYRMIVKYKTAFYTFYLPIAMGMLLSGITDVSAYKLAKEICMEMGEYFQIQDDYLDCFGDPKVIGKVGTDIQDNKCSWLVVQALQKCAPSQRAILEKNYGTWDDKKVKRVKELYKLLELPELFAKYEEESYATIQKLLDEVTLMPRDVFELLLNKIYKRSK